MGDAGGQLPHRGQLLGAEHFLLMLLRAGDHGADALEHVFQPAVDLGQVVGWDREFGQLRMAITLQALQSLRA